MRFGFSSVGRGLLLCSLFALLPGCSAGENNTESPASRTRPSIAVEGKIQLILGQDLVAVRGYRDSGCCPAPAGVTSYVKLYNVLDESIMFGGLGINATGEPVQGYYDFGTSDTSIYEAATEFPGAIQAIGLDITENEHPGALADIAAGKYDAEIAQLHRLFAKTGNPVLLRIGYEFDGVWNRGYENTTNYIAAYRHIVDSLNSLGDHNMAFVWQAASSPVDDILDGFHEDISDWYPGDSYVDWVGLSWFLRPDFVPANAPENTPSQRQLADEVIAFARENGKPVLIAEASPQGFDLKRGYEAAIAPVWNGTAGEKIQALSPTEIWDAWFAPFFDYIHSNSDSIRAVAYINANWDAQTMWGPPYNQGFWGDSRVQSNPDIEALWNKEIGKPVWLHGHQ